MNKLAVDIWSDIACPWCYVGKRRLEAALARFPERDQVQVTWHAFELDPTAAKASPEPPESSAAYAQRLAKKYRSSQVEAERRIAQLTEVAATEGLALHFERIRPGNTFDAHRLIHLARTRGPRLQDAMQERLFRAYFTDGEPVSDPEVLARLVAEVGAGHGGGDGGAAILTADEARSVLATDAFAAEVRADEQRAAASGIRGVPFFVFDNKYAVSGAHPAEALLAALEQACSAHAERAPKEQDAAQSV